MTTLDTCPFCGGADLVVDEISPRIWAVCCARCKAIGPENTSDVGGAEKAWNRRLGDIAWLSQVLNQGDGSYRP